MRRYAIAAVVGAAAALAAALGAVVGTGVLMSAYLWVQMRFGGGGSGGIGAVSSGLGPVLVIAAAGFALGFRWYLRRAGGGRRGRV